MDFSLYKQKTLSSVLAHIVQQLQGWSASQHCTGSKQFIALVLNSVHLNFYSSTLVCFIHITVTAMFTWRMQCHFFFFFYVVIDSLSQMSLFIKLNLFWTCNIYKITFSHLLALTGQRRLWEVVKRRKTMCKRKSWMSKVCHQPSSHWQINETSSPRSGPTHKHTSMNTASLQSLVIQLTLSPKHFKFSLAKFLIKPERNKHLKHLT